MKLDLDQITHAMQAEAGRKRALAQKCDRDATSVYHLAKSAEALDANTNGHAHLVSLIHQLDLNLPGLLLGLEISEGTIHPEPAVTIRAAFRNECLERHDR